MRWSLCFEYGGGSRGYMKDKVPQYWINDFSDWCTLNSMYKCDMAAVSKVKHNITPKLNLIYSNRTITTAVAKITIFYN